MRAIVFLTAGICSLAAVSDSTAQAADAWTDIYVCGGSKGQSLFLDGKSWQPDGIAKGVIILRRNQDKFDLFIGDGIGGFTAREDGAEVFGRMLGDGSLQIFAYYPLSIETYLFSKPDGGRLKVAWTQSKTSAVGAKAALFGSDCVVKR